VPLIPYGKRPKSLPCVLSRDEVRRLFDAVNLPWFLMLVRLTYACGLRLGEVVRLRLTDIDSARMAIHVRCAKGQKDRMVPLSAALLGLLRDYWRQCRPKGVAVPQPARGQAPPPRLGAAAVPPLPESQRHQQEGQHAHAAPQLRHPPAGSRL